MVQERVLNHNDSEDLIVDVVWIPVLAGDNYEEAVKAQKLIPDARAYHFWDGDQALGRVYGQTVELPSGRDLAWDVYFGFGRGTKWEGVVPAPDDWAHQLGMDDRHLRQGDGLQAFMDGLVAE